MTLFDEAPRQEVRRLVFQERSASPTARTSWMARANAAHPVPAIPEPPALPADLSAVPESPLPHPPPREATAPEPVSDGSALAALEQEVRRRMSEQAAMLTRLERSIDELAAVRSTLMAATEKQLVELAGSIARRVLGQELATEPGRILELARQGIEALSERDQVVVRVGAPLNEATLSAFFEGMKSRNARCEVRHDPSLSPGQCLVETDLGRVDESIETRLANVLGQLLPSTESGA